MELGQFTGFRLVFHALQFVVEGEFLIAMKIDEAAAEFHGGGYALKQGGQLLNGRLQGIVVIGRRVSLVVFVDEFLCSRESQLLVTRVDLAGEVMSLGSQLEDAAAGGFGEYDVGLVIVANIGVVGNLAR